MLSEVLTKHHDFGFVVLAGTRYCLDREFLPYSLAMFLKRHWQLVDANTCSMILKEIEEFIKSPLHSSLVARQEWGLILRWLKDPEGLVDEPVSDVEDEIILVIALRYCQGRRSYAVSLMIDYIRSCWEQINIETQKIIQLETDIWIRSSQSKGDRCDADSWNSFNQWLVFNG